MPFRHQGVSVPVKSRSKKVESTWFLKKAQIATAMTKEISLACQLFNKRFFIGLGLIL